MIIKREESVDYVQPQKGLWPAVITSWIDVGTSDDKFNPGKVKREIMVQLTLPTQHNTPENGEKPEMLRISKWMKASMHEKSNLFNFVNSITEVDSDLDMNALLGLNIMVNLTERTHDNGDKRIVIHSVAPPMADQQEYTLPTSKFSFDDWDIKEFEALSEKMQQRLKLTPEYKATGMPF